MSSDEIIIHVPSHFLTAISMLYKILLQ